jgi:hypothetical protein
LLWYIASIYWQLENLHINSMCKQQMQRRRRKSFAWLKMKIYVICSSLFIFCWKGLRRRGYSKWSAHSLIIWHLLVKIDKLPMLVGAKMYTFVRLYLCNFSLSFHIIYCY